MDCHLLDAFCWMLNVNLDHQFLEGAFDDLIGGGIRKLNAGLSVDVYVYMLTGLGSSLIIRGNGSKPMTTIRQLVSGEFILIFSGQLAATEPLSLIKEIHLSTPTVAV